MADVNFISPFELETIRRLNSIGFNFDFAPTSLEEVEEKKEEEEEEEEEERE